MGKIKRLLAAIGTLAILLGLAMAFLVWKTGYSISEMDWDSDGKTSLAEMLHAVDVGRRVTRGSGIECQEFYNLKDGLPVRVDCPKSAMDKK